MLIKSKGERVFDGCNILIMILLALVFLLPVWLIVIASFSSAPALSKYGYSFFIREFSIGSYAYIFTAQDLFLRSIGNSVFITATGTVLMIFTSSLYAYVLARKRLVGRKFLTFFLIIPMLFAGGTIPYYLVINSLGLMNMQWAIILPNAANAWYIILIRNFFTALPESLVESAQLEGANHLKILLRVVMPMSFPILATIILFTAVALWNDWFAAMLFLDSSHRHLWPVQAVLREMEQNFSSLVGAVGGGSSQGLNAEGIKCAAIVTATLPIIIIYPFLQKYFIAGLTVGSVKE